MADEEEKTEAAAEEGNPEEEAGKGKKKKLIIFIALGLLVIGGGGGGAAFFLMSGGGDHAESPSADGSHGSGEHGSDEKADGSDHKDEKSAEGAHGSDGHASSKEGEASPSKGESGSAESGGGFGKVFTFQKPFHLNLGNPLENHYIRLDLAIEYLGGEKQEEEIKAREAQLKDAIISVVSRKSREFLLGPDGKTQLRRDILNALNELVQHKIKSVYITEIIIE